MSVLRWIVVVLAAGRAIHSLPFYLAALSGEWLLPPWGAPDPNVLLVLQEISAFQLVVWTVYITGYAATAAFLALRTVRFDRFAFWAAAVAVLADLGYWIWVTSMPEYVSIETPAFRVEDVIMNMVVFAILIGTGLVRFNQRQ
tara:strand:+ start:475 stop:903 length:429 start_codon:yes stop_codon:yes gene_type:complete